MDEVRVPGDAVLPGVEGLKGPLSCLNEARYGIVWGVMGAARACFDTALEYSKDRGCSSAGRSDVPAHAEEARRHGDRAEQGHAARLHLGRMKDQGGCGPSR